MRAPGCLASLNPDPRRTSGWEDAQLRTGYATGVPVAQIASLIGRPFAGVISRASALGLRHACQPDDWSDAEMNRALELAAAGARYVAIAEVLVAEGFPARNSRSLGQRLRKLGYGRGCGVRGSPRRTRFCAMLTRRARA